MTAAPSPPRAPRAPPPRSRFPTLLLLLLALLLRAPRVALAQLPSPSPTPAPAVCELAIFNDVWAYEVGYPGCLHVDRVTTFPQVADAATGLLETWCGETDYHSVRCKAQLALLTQQPFGPPSAFEVMNAVCKGECQAYFNRYKRVVHAEYISGCSCHNIKSVCPKHPVDILCLVTGLCYDADFYWESTCQPYACGRYTHDEVTYRAQRKACGLTFDGAGVARPGALAAAFAAAAAVAVLRAQAA